MGKQGHIISNLYANYARKARKKGLVFDISRFEFEEIIKLVCYICGRKPSNKRGTLFYNGIDRVDNSKGYLADNVKPCCWRCNNIKSNTPLPVLKRHLQKMLKGLGEL